MRAELLMGVAMFAIGCGAAGAEPETGAAPQPIVTHNRLASNRLASNRLASNRLASNRLASNALDSTKLTALQETAQILSTPEGRDVYAYVVSCALDGTKTIEADVPGAADTPPDFVYTCASGHCTFPGGIGLAPYWADRRLDAAGKGWISACLFARCNDFDTAEAISLRGKIPALVVGAEEAAEFALEEGAFYGNLFVDDPDPSVPPDWHACRGEDEAAGEAGGLANRACAEEDPSNPGYTYCGFEYAGDCRDFTPGVPSPYACRTFDAGPGIYDDCHAASQLGKWSDKAFRQVITSFVSSL